MTDADEDGISVDVGGPNSGFGGAVPTIVASFGLLPVIDYYPGLADDHHHRVDGSFHVHDVAITSSPAHEDGYRVGEDIDVTLTFSTEAYASGDSVIAIRVGDVGPGYRRAGYVSGSGTTRLTYRYRVQLTDFDADGISIPSSGFARELPTTSPELGSIPASRDYTGVGEDAGHKVDGSFRVTGVAIASSPANGDTYRIGEDIEVTLTFSTEAHTSGSVVAIRVGEDTDDANYRPAEYASGSGTTRLTYRYRVRLTDFDVGRHQRRRGRPALRLRRAGAHHQPRVGLGPGLPEVLRRTRGRRPQGRRFRDRRVRRTRLRGLRGWDHGDRHRDAAQRSAPRGDHPDHRDAGRGGDACRLLRVAGQPGLRIRRDEAQRHGDRDRRPRCRRRRERQARLRDTCLPGYAPASRLRPLWSSTTTMDSTRS